jgi:hypothetical protein
MSGAATRPLLPAVADRHTVTATPCSWWSTRVGPDCFVGGAHGWFDVDPASGAVSRHTADFGGRK